MWKKFLCVFASALLCTCCLLPAAADSGSDKLRRGDTVEYIFSIGECDNVAGIAVVSYYNSSLLTPDGDPQFLIGGAGIANAALPATVKWNIMINGGRAFSGEDVLVEKFTVTQACSADDLQLSYICDEMFNHDLQTLPSELLSARINILPTGTDDDKPSDSTPIDNSDIDDTDSAPVSSVTSQTPSASESRTESKPNSSTASVKPVIITTTDLIGSDDEEDPAEPTAPVASRTTSRQQLPQSAVSSKTSSVASSKTSSAAGSSSKLSTETRTTPSSRTAASSAVSSQGTSAAPSSSASKATPANASQQKTSSAAVTSSSSSTVQTAGRIVIAALAGILAAAGVTVLLSRKIKTID